MVYESEFSSRRVYSSPRPNVAHSYTYTINPIARRRNKPTGLTRVIRSPTPLRDQEILDLFTTPTRTTTREYVAVDPPFGDRNDNNSSYKKTFSTSSSTSSSSGNSSGEPGGKTIYKKTETVTRNDGSGPQTTSYTKETSRNDGGRFPSFNSSTSYRNPGQSTSFRHFSFH